MDGQIHTPVFPDLEGDTLFTELVNEFTTTTVLFPSRARDTLYGVVYNEADTVRGVYTGHALPLPPGVDPSIHLFMNGSPKKITQGKQKDIVMEIMYQNLKEKYGKRDGFM